MSTRRNFIKTAGLTFAGAGLGMNNPLFAMPDAVNTDLPQQIKNYSRQHTQRFNMAGFAAPKISTVRLGIIGLGNRGSNHVQTMSQLEGVEIKALCDLHPEREDLDLIIITMPWYMHAQMGIYAMKQGKHVLSEVPAAGTIDECWQLVETAEQTKKHFVKASYHSAKGGEYAVHEIGSGNYHFTGFVEL